MRRQRAISSIGAAACAGLLLSGACPPVVPLACLAVILLDATWLAPRALRPPPNVLVALQLLLVVPVLYLALLRNPPIDFLTLLLVASAPLIVMRLLREPTDFNDFLILLLSLLLVIGSAALAPGAVPIAITAVYVLVGCHALSVIACRAGDPSGSVRFRLERPAGWWASAPTLAAHHLGIAGLVLGAIFYLVAPRPDVSVGGGSPRERLFGAGERSTEGRTTAGRPEFPRQVRLGDIGRLKRRAIPALRVEVRARGRPYDPGAEERSMLLLRARAWDRYDPAARRWEPARDAPLPLPRAGTIEVGESELDWSFTVLAYDGKSLFLPPRSRRVRAAGGTHVLAIDRLGDVTSSVPVFEYDVASAWPVRRGEIRGLAVDLSDRALVQVPDAAARVLRPHLPKAPRGDIGAAAAAISAYFSESSFRYTLDLPPSIDRASDPLLAFLEEREGDCELYATTACLFLRLMGVPARVAGGLRLSERIGPGDYQARLSNAHAWVEVKCKDMGFVALDFTPPDTAAVAPTPVPGAAVEEEGGAAGGEEPAVSWSDPFAYGPDEQERVLGWFQDRLLGWPTLATFFLLVLLLAGPRLVEAARERPPNPLRVSAPAGQKRSTLAFYAHWLKECAAKGYVRARVETPREFLATLPLELRVEGARITAEFEIRRYGPPAPP